MKLKNVKKRLLLNPAIDPGQRFTKKSPTIPGQDLSPQEIMRLFAKERPRAFYSELELHQLAIMDPFEKMEKLRELKTTTATLSEQIQAAKNNIKKLKDTPPAPDPVV